MADEKKVFFHKKQDAAVGTLSATPAPVPATQHAVQHAVQHSLPVHAKFAKVDLTKFSTPHPDAGLPQSRFRVHATGGTSSSAPRTRKEAAVAAAAKYAPVPK